MGISDAGWDDLVIRHGLGEFSEIQILKTLKSAKLEQWLVHLLEKGIQSSQPAELNQYTDYASITETLAELHPATFVKMAPKLWNTGNSKLQCAVFRAGGPIDDLGIIGESSRKALIDPKQREQWVFEALDTDAKENDSPLVSLVVSAIPQMTITKRKKLLTIIRQLEKYSHSLDWDRDKKAAIQSLEK